MHSRQQRGFVLGELLLAVAAFSVLVAFERSVATELDRLCVGAAPTSNDAPQPRIVTDVRHWVCVSISSDEPAENSYVAGNDEKRRRFDAARKAR